MDSFLVEYLSSGNAVVLIGSGPSTAMGYPSWDELASAALASVRSENPSADIKKLEGPLSRHDYPAVFDQAEKIIGLPRLRQILSNICTPKAKNGKVYELIAKWPVKTFLTTNFDDELQTHLAALGEAYLAYNNSEDHLAQLVPDLSGAIFKLHGDFRSDDGLILTRSQYNAIQSGPNYEYWRTKMTSVFQMLPVVIVGHSLTDENFRHVLAAAKKGCGVTNPVVWIAPDVSFNQSREYLEKYRIRVVSYDNRDGTHRHLTSLLEDISSFVPPRLKYQARDQVLRVTNSSLGNNAAAPGLYVFNKICLEEDFEKKRQDVVIAAMLAGLKTFDSRSRFTIEEVLRKAGWPSDQALDMSLRTDVLAASLADGTIVEDGGFYRIGPQCSERISALDTSFMHLKNRFLMSLKLKIKRKFPTVSDKDAEDISTAIDLSLAGFFREGGLTLSSLIFSGKERNAVLPTSILKFFNEACTRYDQSLLRQAFFSAATGIFVHPESAEREYLGRMSQGFFAFHALGVFGETAAERYKEAARTVWLLDSSVQIPALAIGHSANPVFLDTIRRLTSGGLRLFTTEKLFEETREHFWYANLIAEKYGPQSQDVLYAATGQPPYRKSNVFLEGFINWQAAGNPGEWKDYCYYLFNSTKPDASDIKNRLASLGVEIVDFQNWPGFTSEDFAKCDEFFTKIADIRNDRAKPDDPDYDPYKKSRPEAEALVIVLDERAGKYYMLSESGQESHAWFVSGTSILNIITSSLIAKTIKVTWQPESFLNFASTLSPIHSKQAAEQAFDVLLWSVAQSGLSLINEEKIHEVFKGIIDQAQLSIDLQKQMYDETLQNKYGEPIEVILNRLSVSKRPLATTQLAYEIAAEQSLRAEHAERTASEEAKKARVAEKIAGQLQHLQKKLSAKQIKAKKQQRKSKKKK